MLSFSLYRYRLRVVERLRLSWFLGNALRGVFGRSFRHLLCALHKQDCGVCELRGDCPYARVFSPVLPEGAERLRSMRDIPRPFVLRTDFEPGRLLEEGDEFAFEMVVVGDARKYLPYFLISVQNLAMTGFGMKGERGRMRLVGVDVHKKEKKEWKEIFTLKDGLLDTSEEGFVWDDFVKMGGAVSRRLELRFVTPTRIVERGRVVREPEFVHIVKRLRDRLNMLSVFYCGGELGLDYKGLGERAEAVECVERELEWVEQSRYMRGKRRWHPMGGYIGRMEFEGEFGEFLPLLYAGEYLHLGKFAVWGYGRIKVRVL